MANAAMGKMLARDAAVANVLMVVVGSLAQRRPELMDWLASLPPLMSLPHGLLVGLLGDEDDRGEELDWTAKQLIERARESNRKFIWHWMRHHDEDPSDWLAKSVESLFAIKQPIHEPIIMREVAAVWQAA